MSDLQLFIAAGLPTLTVLIGILLNQRSLDGLEKRFGDRFAEVDRRFVELEKRLDRMEARLDRMEARLDRVEADLREFYRVMGLHEARLDNIEKRIA